MTELIKTRKQYEETLDFLKINRFAYDEANEIDELIEALREVARGADSLLMLLGAVGAFGSLSESGPDADQLKTLVDALPDWITENG